MANTNSQTIENSRKELSYELTWYRQFLILKMKIKPGCQAT